MKTKPYFENIENNESLIYFGERNKPMCRVCELAKVIINICIANKFHINVLKLQRLLTIIQGEYLAKYNEPLFKEEIIAKTTGISINEVSNTFFKYGYEIKVPLFTYIILLDKEKEVIFNVLAEYGDAKIKDLDDIIYLKQLFASHYEKDKTNIIPKNIIRDVFSGNSNKYYSKGERI